LTGVVFVIAEWLQVHVLDHDTVYDCLAAVGGGQISFDLQGVVPVKGALGDAGYATVGVVLTSVIGPALAPLLGMETSAVADLIASIRWGDVSEDGHPHTIDHGTGKPPEIRMFWQGSAADLVCLAHEVAHAVQLQLSTGSFMPPVARETCAFLGELALIDWARKTDTPLAAKLLSVWQEENEAYFGEDRDLLRSALADPTATYTYRMNYPLARAAAIVMHRSGAEAQRLFRAGAEAMALLPLADIADLAGRSQNYLPPLPPPDAETPAVNAYRALGAMALLDIDFWKGESERRIEDYYASLLHHLQTRTAFIALDDVHRPIGYATWRKAAGDNAVILTRKAAPFGDHLLLQKALQRHLGQDTDVLAHHERSARSEQTAW
jgi:hemolysin-activating ACP:hemolysin acyltransferase